MLFLLLSVTLQLLLGMYCKWTIRGDTNSSLRVLFKNINIPPMSERCEYDGVLFYDGYDILTAQRHGWLIMHVFPFLLPVCVCLISDDVMRPGPYCGSSLNDITLEFNSSVISVVFFSDSRGGKRVGGQVRMIISTQGNKEVKYSLILSSRDFIFSNYQLLINIIFNIIDLSL